MGAVSDAKDVRTVALMELIHAATEHQADNDLSLLPSVLALRKCLNALADAEEAMGEYLAIGMGDGDLDGAWVRLRSALGYPLTP